MNAFIKFNQAEIRKQRRKERMSTIIYIGAIVATFMLALYGILEIEMHVL